MFRNLVFAFFIFVNCFIQAMASDIFDYPVSVEEAAMSFPELDSVSCSFTQERTLSDTTLKSGGNFQFIKDKGVIFETLYPVKTTTSYASAQNKQINDIITGIANKNYTDINKNFTVYYQETDDNWCAALKPKPKTPACGQLESIIIYGGKYINRISINPVNGNKTDIRFYCE